MTGKLIGIVVGINLKRVGDGFYSFLLTPFLIGFKSTVKFIDALYGAIFLSLFFR